MISLSASTLLLYALALKLDPGNPPLPIIAQPVTVRPSPSPSPSNAHTPESFDTDADAPSSPAQTAYSIFCYSSVPVIFIALVIRRYIILKRKEREETINASTGDEIVQIDGSGNGTFTII